ncbi:hypothetical protein SMD22_01660 (plasmid) [Brevibacillus halotolerans]|nr:hypothetical protein SMD22_01660 [Brevibacillus halotolerans]
MVEIVNGLVSERVMGWSRKILTNNEEGHPYYADYWVDDNEVKKKPVNFWKPATDIKDAYMVIEKLREKGILIINEACMDKYKATYDGNFEAFSTSASLAVCIAALKAVGVEMAAVYAEVK